MFRPDRHTLFTFTDGTLIGIPALTAAWRLGTCPWPAISTCPMMTWSTSSGATPARSSAAAIAKPPRSAAERDANAPLSFAIGVRAPATMYEPVAESEVAMAKR